MARRRVDERALADLDSLAEVHAPAATEVFKEKRGEDGVREFSPPETGMRGRGPSGESFVDDKAHPLDTTPNSGSASGRPRSANVVSGTGDGCDPVRNSLNGCGHGEREP